MERIGFGLIGLGRQSDLVHARALRRSGVARIAAVCDADAELVALRSRQYAGGDGPVPGYTRYADLLERADVQAVVIATPNVLHPEIAEAAAAAGKHILCEKPLALSTEDALRMLEAARRHDVRHMTAFTYRFVPAMRYLRHLVSTGGLGTVRMVRSRRLMDWPDADLGWRQVRSLAGSGELGDMASHRFDHAQAMLGPIVRVQGLTRCFVPERRASDGGVRPADVEDWAACLAEFAGGATGVFESSKLCRGYGRGDAGVDDFEVNGDGGSAFFRLGTPLQLSVGRPGGTMETVPVPEAFSASVAAGLATVAADDPGAAFRDNQMYAFIDAIRSGRDCSPNFLDGARVMAVIEAVQRSAAGGRAVDVVQVG